MGEILDLHAQIQLTSGCMTMRRPVNLVDHANTEVKVVRKTGKQNTSTRIIIL